MLVARMTWSGEGRGLRRRNARGAWIPPAAHLALALQRGLKRRELRFLRHGRVERKDAQHQLLLVIAQHQLLLAIYRRTLYLVLALALARGGGCCCYCCCSCCCYSVAAAPDAAAKRGGGR